MQLLFSCSLFFSFQTKSIESTGDIIQILNPASFIFMTLVYEDYEGTKQAIYGSLATAISIQTLKHAFNNVTVSGDRLGERPNGGDLNFPSGHTTSAFYGAWAIQKRYGISHSLVPLIGAALVGYSRIRTDHHDIKAVFAGMALGIGIAELFTDSFSDSSFRLGMGLSEKGIGLSFYQPL